MLANERGISRNSEPHLVQLAIKSAIGESKDARKAWRELINLQEFTKFASDISRIIPAIYSNIGDDSALPEIPRLRGVGKRTWSRNQQLIGGIAPALQDIESINYRLLKGSALLLLTGNFSSRSMGDVDLLISKKDIGIVTKALLSNGFHNEFESFCPHFPVHSHSPELTFVNQNGVQIDLHISENHHARELFESMLNNPPIHVEHRGYSLKIPTPEFMLIHTIQHGAMNVAPGDLLQTEVDSHVLMKKIESSTLDEFIKDSVVNQQTIRVIREKYPTSFSNYCDQKNRRLYQTNKCCSYKQFFRLIGKAQAIFRYRRLNARVAWKASREIGPKRVLYFIWLSLGKPRFLEALVSRLANGFYAENASTNSARRILSQEIRFKLLGGLEESAVYLEVFGPPLANTSFLLFKDGILETTIGGKGKTRFSEAIRLNGRRSEISIRLSRRCCSSCASKYGEIEVGHEEHTI